MQACERTSSHNGLRLSIVSSSPVSVQIRNLVSYGSLLLLATPTRLLLLSLHEALVEHLGDTGRHT